MKSLLNPLILFGTLVPLMLGAATVEEIVKKHETAKIEELRAYLNDNADAEDAPAAREALIQSLMAIGDEAGTIPLFEAKFADLIAAEGDPDLQQLLGNTVAPLVYLYKEAGRKADAGKLLTDAAQALGPAAQSQGVAQFFQQLEGELAQLGVGEVMELKFTSTAGHDIDLAKMKGKVVLVDFWATWCGPCVQEMPNVIAAYEKHHEAGFEVIGISLDSDKAALEQFTKSRGMEWAQYFDGKQWENEISTAFGIRSIPATFLIGKDGKIAGTDLRGADLEAKIAELLKAEG